MKDPPKNAAELDARLSALPQKTRTVYTAIQGSLYAEPGFSDVKTGHIVRSLGSELASVRGSLGHLMDEGLVHMEAEGWLHTYEHDNHLRNPDD